MARYQYLAALLLLRAWAAGATDIDGTSVGYCAGPPSGSYEHKSCSVHDNAALLAASRVVGGDHKFCTTLLKSQWNYLPLDHDHTIPEENVQHFLSVRGANTHIERTIGYFDINNDGRPEYLAWLSAYSGSGQGCDIEMYVEVDNSRSRIKDSPLTRLLGDNPCETYQRAFRFKNKVYIENRRTVERSDLDFSLPDILTEVYIIEGQSKRSVCSFALRKAR
jgi:hypothetical protein